MNQVVLEVFIEVIMMNAFFQDMMSCGSYNNQRFRGTYRVHHQGGKNQ
jgi:hypothetical protein